MSKKLIALVLCLVMVVPFLAACKPDPNYVGPIVNMYLSEIVYDFDPLYAFNNESALKVVSLLFEPLFRLNKNGKVEKALVKEYKYSKDDLNQEYSLLLKFNETNWSDGTYVSANDLVYAWKRILDPENSNEAASLLYDVKNARLVKEGESSIDTLGVYAVDELEVQIDFEYDIDVDMFLYKLTSYALVPLREDIVAKNNDWAKKNATMVCSGPFIPRTADYGMDPRIDKDMRDPCLHLERNAYYYRDKLKDSINKSVEPYKIKITFNVTREEQYEMYKNGTLFFMNDFALSQRAEVKDSVELYDANSTHSYIFNTEALVQKAGSTEGYPLFADAKVRRALSLAIDREAIAQQIVFAKPATGYVPYGVFATNSTKSLYRDVTNATLATTANVAEAQKLLAEAGINPADFTFAISIRSGKEVHKAIADAVAAVWGQLGFNVTVKEVAPIVNNDDFFGEDPQQDICDDKFNETYFYRHPDTDGKGDQMSFEVLGVDVVAQSIDPLNVLSVYATAFSGQGMDLSSLSGNEEYKLTPHISNYESEEYNAKIEEAFAEKDLTKRLALLQEAEAMLMEDAPVCPIIFNQSARLVSNELSGVKYDWFGRPDFRNIMLKDFERFAESTESEEEEEAVPSETEATVGE